MKNVYFAAVAALVIFTEAGCHKKVTKITKGVVSDIVINVIVSDSLAKDGTPDYKDGYIYHNLTLLQVADSLHKHIKNFSEKTALGAFAIMKVVNGSDTTEINPCRYTGQACGDSVAVPEGRLLPLVAKK